MLVNRTTFFGLGFITLFGFSSLGFLINAIFMGDEWHAIFRSEWNFFLQVGLGIAYGLLGGYLGWLLIKSKWLNQSLNKYARLISDLDLNIHEIIFISFCAGFGEEVLFRGSLQHYWGIWITAVIFVAIHGYLNPKDWRISVYGVFMTLVIAGMGYGYEYMGLWFSIFAHFAVDVILLYKLTSLGKKEEKRQKALREKEEQGEQESLE